MADEKIEQAGARAEDSETRREWVKPQIQDMMAGAAEAGSNLNVDGGDPGLS